MWERRFTTYLDPGALPYPAGRGALLRAGVRMAHPFETLTPDLVLDAVESIGFLSDARILALNSYENRVYQVGIEDSEPLIAKFYRPQRWTNEAILEEHSFTFELAECEVPVVAPMIHNGESLFEHAGFRFTLFPRPLGVKNFGHDSLNTLLEGNFIPRSLLPAYESVARDLLKRVEEVYKATPHKNIRMHGDCHPGNMMCRDEMFHIVDLDDCRMGPAVQDLWMMLAGDRQECLGQLSELMDGYQEFHDFDPRELALIEPLRALRLMHYSAWLARRWDDPAFPHSFPWFGSERYWGDQVLALREQLSLPKQGFCMQAANPRRGYILGLSAYVIWGLFPIYFKAIASVPAAEIIVNRVLWSALFGSLLLIVWKHPGWLRELRDNPRRLAILALSGTLIAANWLTYVWSVNSGRMLEASLGYYINPLVNVLLGMVILGERLRRLQWVAVGLAAVGVAQQVWQVGSLPWVSLVLAATFGFYGLIRKQAPVKALPGLVVETWMLVPIAIAWLLFNPSAHSAQMEFWSTSEAWWLVAAGPVTLIPLVCFNAAARHLPYTALGFLQYVAPTLVLLEAVL
eukprot:gene19972-23746_t